MLGTSTTSKLGAGSPETYNAILKLSIRFWPMWSSLSIRAGYEGVYMNLTSDSVSTHEIRKNSSGIIENGDFWSHLEQT